MQEIFEARGIEAEDWPAWDDEVWAQAHRALGRRMEETAIAIHDQPSHASLQELLLNGDLSGLTTSEILKYYQAVCQSVGLNPLTQPFDWITLQGKKKLYANRNCADQLRSLRHVSIHIASREIVDDLYIVIARATTLDGRHDEKMGAVPIAGLKGEARANALMKAETKASRRVTLSICGLSMLDATEVESLPSAVVSQERSSPNDPSLTRMEEQHVIHALGASQAEGMGGASGPFAGSALQGPASTAAQDSAALGASGMPSPNTTPMTSAKPRLLSRAQLEKAINAEFRRLADSYDTAALCTKVWGPKVDRVAHVRTLGDASLRTGLKKLQAIPVEQPPAPTQAGEGAISSPAAGSSASAEEDVPNFPPPSGNPQEGPQEAPGSTQSVGSTQVAVVDSSSKGEAARQCPVSSKAGIRCALEVRDDGTHEGDHYFASARPDDRPIKLPAYGQVIVVPDPETGVRYISTSDGMLLRQYCQQHDLMSFFTVAVEKSPRNVHGNLMIDERQYWQMRAFAEAQVSTEQQGIPKADFVFDAKGGANLA